MYRTHRSIEPGAVAVRRLRRGLFGASVVAMLVLCTLMTLWLLVGGASPADLVMPLVGAALALAAELLCLDAAIRRAGRLTEPERAPLRTERPRPIGV